MSCDDGLVMTLHPGVCRGHHGPTAAKFGPDTGSDIPIPARHDTSRRIDAGVLAQLVAEHQLGEDEALETAVDLVTKQPTTVFKL